MVMVIIEDIHFISGDISVLLVPSLLVVFVGFRKAAKQFWPTINFRMT